MDRKRKATSGAHVSTKTFDEFLKEEGLLAETEVQALREIIADQIASAIKRGRAESR